MSRVRSLRSKAARTCSVKDGGVSTTTKSYCVRATRSSSTTTWDGHPVRIRRVGWRGDDVQPARLVRGHHRGQALLRRGAHSSTTRSRTELCGDELEADRHVAEHQVEVDEQRRGAGRGAGTTARLVDTVVLPTPPLAEKTVTTVPSRPPTPWWPASWAVSCDAPAHGVGEGGLVVSLDDLAHPAPEGLAERGDVEPVAQEDHARAQDGRPARARRARRPRREGRPGR